MKPKKFPGQATSLTSAFQANDFVFTPGMDNSKKSKMEMPMSPVMLNRYQPALKLIFVIGLLGLIPGFSSAEDAPWWPHPKWGAEDQAGASNWITPEKILSSLSLVKTGKVYELGHIYQRGMPLVGKRSYNMYIPSIPTHGPIGDKKVVFNDEFLATEIGQVGTQLDGPGHVGQQRTLQNGNTTEVFYNGFTTEEMANAYELQKLGVENIKPYLTRGILLDIAGFKKVKSLPEGYAVSMHDVRGALKKQGINLASITPGDALLFNFGWWRYWPGSEPVTGNTPHIDEDVVTWIISKEPSMVGSDTNLDGADMLVHTEITMKNGIWNLELMNFSSILEDKVHEFLFVFTPLRIKGATGSPGRPIAIR